MKVIKKMFLALIVLCVAAGSALLIVNGVVRYSAKKYILSPDEPGEGYDCILVLGCGVRAGVPSDLLADRLDRGIELFKAGASGRLLMSGDHGSEYYDEVNVMKSYAVERGVDPAAVFMDHAGFSTYESMYRARDVFCAKKVLIVTQPYHLYRAVYDARRLGLDACGVEAMPRQYAGQLYFSLREVLARGKDFVFTLFKPLPTCLGGEIPLTGSGEQTDDK